MSSQPMMKSSDFTIWGLQNETQVGPVSLRGGVDSKKARGRMRLLPARTTCAVGGRNGAFGGATLAGSVYNNVIEGICSRRLGAREFTSKKSLCPRLKLSPCHFVHSLQSPRIFAAVVVKELA